MAAACRGPGPGVRRDARTLAHRCAARFWQREGELIDAGDIAGAAELNVATWLGPEASQATRERVRLMQRHALEVQLAAGVRARRGCR